MAHAPPKMVKLAFYQDFPPKCDILQRNCVFPLRDLILHALMLPGAPRGWNINNCLGIPMILKPWIPQKLCFPDRFTFFFAITYFLSKITIFIFSLLSIRKTIFAKACQNISNSYAFPLFPGATSGQTPPKSAEMLHSHQFYSNSQENQIMNGISVNSMNKCYFHHPALPRCQMTVIPMDY